MALAGRITNKDGKEFLVRVLFEGDNYGRKDCLTHEGETPLIEFFDAKYEFDIVDAEADLKGQFVSRYFLDTLTSECKWFSGTSIFEGRGLILDGGVPAWKIDSNAVRELGEFLQVNNVLNADLKIEHEDPGFAP